MDQSLYIQTTVLEVYEYFNNELFDNTLPSVFINFSRESKKSYGYFCSNRWTSGKAKYHEINLNPYFFQRDIKETYATLVHEMVHLWQQDFGKKPPRKCYHNKEWGQKMKEVGLYPSNTGQIGGKETGQNCSHYIIEQGAYEYSFDSMDEALKIKIKNLDIPQSEKPKKAKDKICYICTNEECNSKVWAKPDMKIACFHTQDSEEFSFMIPN